MVLPKTNKMPQNDLKITPIPSFFIHFIKMANVGAGGYRRQIKAKSWKIKILNEKEKSWEKPVWSVRAWPGGGLWYLVGRLTMLLVCRYSQIKIIAQKRALSFEINSTLRGAISTTGQDDGGGTILINDFCSQISYFPSQMPKTGWSQPNITHFSYFLISFTSLGIFSGT